MFNNDELKAIRQEIDGLTEQIRILVENQDIQHQEVMARLDELGESIEKNESDDIGKRINEIESEVSEVKDIVTNIDEHMGEAEGEKLKIISRACIRFAPAG